MSNQTSRRGARQFLAGLRRDLRIKSKAEPRETIKAWLRWSNDKREIKKLTGATGQCLLGSEYRKRNKANNVFETPQYNDDSMFSADVAMAALSRGNRMVINQEFLHGGHKTAGKRKQTYYSELNEAFDEFVRLGGLG